MKCPRCGHEGLERHSVSGAERCAQCHLPHPMPLPRGNNRLGLAILVAGGIVLLASVRFFVVVVPQ